MESEKVRKLERTGLVISYSFIIYGIFLFILIHLIHIYSVIDIENFDFGRLWFVVMITIFGMIISQIFIIIGWLIGLLGSIIVLIRIKKRKRRFAIANLIMWLAFFPLIIIAIRYYFVILYELFESIIYLNSSLKGISIFIVFLLLIYLNINLLLIRRSLHKKELIRPFIVIIGISFISSIVIFIINQKTQFFIIDDIDLFLEILPLEVALFLTFAFQIVIIYFKKFTKKIDLTCVIKIDRSKEPDIIDLTEKD